MSIRNSNFSAHDRIYIIYILYIIRRVMDTKKNDLTMCFMYTLIIDDFKFILKFSVINDKR